MDDRNCNWCYRRYTPPVELDQGYRSHLFCSARCDSWLETTTRLTRSRRR